MKGAVTLGLMLYALVSCQPSLTEREVREYQERGDKIVQSSTEKLSSTLMSKMKEGGAPEAILFCNESALPITKKMAESQGVEIKRTSLKIRNIENLPDEEELKVLHYFEDKLAEGKPLNPVVSLDQEGNPNYYAPIRVQQQCLMCHGTLNKEVPPGIDSILKVKYPEDVAVGYKTGDLRGMWSISFPKLKR